MDKQNKKSAIKIVTEFINSLSNVGAISKETNFEMFFSVDDEGTLVLDGEDFHQYRETLKTIIDTYGSEKISQKAIEKLFQKTILTVLDINEKRKEKTFLQRLEIAVEELHKSLTAVPTVFKVYYPINGLLKDGLPIKIGNVLFCVFDSEQYAQFYKILMEYKGDDKIRSNNAAFAESIKQSDIVGKTVGLVEVNAVDSEAAKISAIKELSFTRDIINFYSDLIPYFDGHIFLPGDKERCTINIPIIEQKTRPGFIFAYESVGPLMPLSLKQLSEVDEKQHLGLLKVNSLLSKKRNDLEEKLLAAIQWSGRATVETNKEDAFILYAISLESLVLIEKDKNELGYRLQIRVAHLLGKNLERRKKIFSDIKYLYTIRSNIVHNGTIQVTDADLKLIRYYSKGCILHILNDEPFASMLNSTSLSDWFFEQVLWEEHTELTS